METLLTGRPPLFADGAAGFPPPFPVVSLAESAGLEPLFLAVGAFLIAPVYVVLP